MRLDVKKKKNILLNSNYTLKNKLLETGLGVRVIDYTKTK